MRIDVTTDLEMILDWQCRGMTARKLGLAAQNNPLLIKKPPRTCDSLEQWQLKCDAWAFGWSIEDCFSLEDALIAA